MADNTTVCSISIKNDKAEWLKKQKELTGNTESFFVDKGLDIVIHNIRLKLIKESWIVIFYLLVSIIFFAFGVLFQDVLPLSIFAIVFFGSAVGVLISGYGCYKIIILLKK